MLTAKDQARIAEAVGDAEAGTSGEIVCVLASEVSHYPEVALGWAAITALALSYAVLAPDRVGSTRGAAATIQHAHS